MKRVDHPTARDARTELVKHGYRPLCPAPGETRTAWRRPGHKKPVLTIRLETRPRSAAFHIVPADGGAEQLGLLEDGAS